MDQRNIEKRLTYLYVLCTIAGAVVSITSGIAWGHWKQTLDQCVGRNCTCILYGEHTRTVFLGGDIGPCIWVTFGPLIYLVFTIGLSCFHGFRVLFTKTRTRTVVSKNEVGETVEMHAVQTETTTSLPRAFWITASTVTTILTLYALIHFAIFIDGYLRTCNQYKRTLEVLLGIHGTAIPVIHNRLSCNAIFDFMDYMQVDSGNSYREGFIQTGIALTIGLVASFLSWLYFLGATYFNVKMARAKI